MSVILKTALLALLSVGLVGCNHHRCGKKGGFLSSMKFCDCHTDTCSCGQTDDFGCGCGSSHGSSCGCGSPAADTGCGCATTSNCGATTNGCSSYAPTNQGCTACGQASSGGCYSDGNGTSQHFFESAPSGIPSTANSPIPDAPPVDNRSTAVRRDSFYIPASATAPAPNYYPAQQQQPRLLTVPSGMTVPAGLY